MQTQAKSLSKFHCAHVSVCSTLFRIKLSTRFPCLPLLSPFFLCLFSLSLSLKSSSTCRWKASYSVALRTYALSGIPRLSLWLWCGDCILRAAASASLWNENLSSCSTSRSLFLFLFAALAGEPHQWWLSRLIIRNENRTWKSVANAADYKSSKNV